MPYRTEEFNDLNSVFTETASDLLENENSTVNNLQFVLDAYNALVIYAEIDYENKRNSTKQYITSVLEANRTILSRCYEKLNSPTVLPGKLLSHIHYLPPSDKSVHKTVKTQSSETQTIGEVLAISDTQTDPILTQTIETQTAMTQTKAEFLKLAGSLLNYKFEGDPLKLPSFLADVDMVEDIAEEVNMATCIKFVKRCISGRALEFIPENANTIREIKQALTDNIKPESSEVVEGKLLSLRVKKGDFTEFSGEAEKLAEAFRRSLVVSGITKAKAQEMTIKKTIELCRKTARFETVKSVISSTRYEQPADVLATLITQNDIARKEKIEADAIKAKQQNKNTASQNRNGKSNGRGNGRGNFSQNGNRNGNNFRQQNGQRDQQQQRGNSNSRGNGQNRNFQNRQNRNEHTIRFVTGNSMGPMQGQLGFPQQQMFQQQQPQQDQVYQIPFQ